MRNSDERILDIRDFIAEVLRNWKRILLTMFLLALLIIGFGGMSSIKASHNSNVAAGSEEQPDAIASARSKLNQAEIEEVDSLYEQFMSYRRFRKQYQTVFDDFNQMYKRDDSQQVIKRLNYYVSSSIPGINKFYVENILNEDDYNSIKDLLPDVDTVEAAYRYVRIEASTNDPSSVVLQGADSSDLPYQYIIDVEILGDKKETCDKIGEVVNAGVDRAFKSLRKIDETASIDAIDPLYHRNIYSYISASQQAAFDNIQKVDTTIYNLKNNYIDKLSEEQKEYYSLLRYPETGDTLSSSTEVTGRSFFSKKLLILGVIFGLFFSIGIFLLQYTMSSAVHVGYEMEKIYGIPVLSTFCFNDTSSNPFSGLIRKIKRTGLISPEVKAEIAAADLEGMIEKSGVASLYLLQTYDSNLDKKAISLLESAVTDQSSDYRVISGAPVGNAADIKELTRQKNVILFVHMQKTERADLESVLNLCARHSINVLGTIEILEV